MSPFMLVLAIITGLTSLTRATRLIVDDTYPPTEWLKAKLMAKLPERWHQLFECPWCAAPYLALPATIWFALLVQFPTWTVNNWLWWCVNGWAAASWVAAFATLRDQPPDSR